MVVVDKSTETSSWSGGVYRRIFVGCMNQFEVEPVAVTLMEQSFICVEKNVGGDRKVVGGYWFSWELKTKRCDSNVKKIRSSATVSGCFWSKYLKVRMV